MDTSREKKIKQGGAVTVTNLEGLFDSLLCLHFSFQVFVNFPLWKKIRIGFSPSPIYGQRSCLPTLWGQNFDEISAQCFHY